MAREPRAFPLRQIHHPDSAKARWRAQARPRRARPRGTAPRGRPRARGPAAPARAPTSVRGQAELRVARGPRVRGQHVPRRTGLRPEQRGLQLAPHTPGHPGSPAPGSAAHAAAAGAARGPGARLPPPEAPCGGFGGAQRYCRLLGGMKPEDPALQQLGQLSGLRTKVPKPWASVLSHLLFGPTGPGAV